MDASPSFEGMSSVPPPNSTLVELSTALGDDSARELVDMYLSNFANVLGDLKSKDREQRRRAAHSLKSSSTIVGADALSARMAELEMRLTETTADVTPADLDGTVADFEKIAVSLRAYAKGG
jgi:HPt (histidine-containing phosphotransfer) domain-containing protein